MDLLISLMSCKENIIICSTLYMMQVGNVACGGIWVNMLSIIVMDNSCGEFLPWNISFYDRASHYVQSLWNYWIKWEPWNKKCLNVYLRPNMFKMLVVFNNLYIFEECCDYVETIFYLFHMHHNDWFMQFLLSAH